MHRYTAMALVLALTFSLPIIAACTPEEPVDESDDRIDIEYEEDQLIVRVRQVEKQFGRNPSLDKALEAIKKLQPLRDEAISKHLYNAKNEAVSLQKKYDRTLTKHLAPKMRKILDDARKAYEDDSIEEALKQFEGIDRKWLQYGAAASQFLQQKKIYVNIKKVKDQFPIEMGKAEGLEREGKFFEAYDSITGFYASASPSGGCYLSVGFQSKIKNLMDILESQIVKEFNFMDHSEKKQKFQNFINRHNMDIRTVGNFLKDFKKIGKELGINVR